MEDKNKKVLSVSERHAQENKDKDVEEVLIDVEAYLTKPGKCQCGEEYTYAGLGRYVCKRCHSEFLNEYGRVREFVDKYGTNYNMLEVAEITKVPKRLIDIFVKDGRFDTVKRQRRCAVCHNPIDKGQYCNKCALRQIKEQLDTPKHVMGSIHVQDDMKGAMHYINKDNI